MLLCCAVLCFTKPLVKKRLLDVLVLMLDSERVPFKQGIMSSADLLCSLQGYMCKYQFKSPDGMLVGGIMLPDMLVKIIARWKVRAARWPPRHANTSTATGVDTFRLHT